jgi:hypothetical protein
MLALFSPRAVKAPEQTTQVSTRDQRICNDMCNLDAACREDFLGEWTKRGLVYRPDLTASIAKDCYMCQLHYLRYNLLIFEVRRR